jgi:predicted PurR-regulated permease PerM
MAKATVKVSKKKTVKIAVPKDTGRFNDLMLIQKLPGYFLIICVIASLVGLFYIIWPFITVLFVAAVLTIAFYPIYKGIVSFFGDKYHRVAALISCLLVVLVIVVPVSFFTIALAEQAVETYSTVNEEINSGALDNFFKWESGGVIYDIKESVRRAVEPVVDFEKLDLKGKIIERAGQFTEGLFTQVQTVFTGVFNLLFSFFLMLFSMFYFFKDGEKIVAKIGYMSPLPQTYEIEFFKKTDSMVKAIVFGVFLTAMIQGVVGGIGFAFAGIPNALFWGTAMAFFSLVPMVGTALIWGPAAIIMAALGNFGAAIFIAIWGVLAIGSVDNIVRPYLIGGRAHTYPLLTFFVILGGIWTMGFKGVIIGPLILMILMSFLHIYESEYSKVLKR